MGAYSWFDTPPAVRLGLDAAVQDLLDVDIDAEVTQAATDAVTAALASALTAAEVAEAVVFDNGNSGAAKTVDLANGACQKITLTAAGPTLTLAGFSAGHYGEILLYLIQDGTGSRTLPTFSPAARYGAAGAPVLSTAAASVDIVKVFSIDGGTTVNVVLVEKGA